MSPFKELLREYPSLTTQDGLVALLAEYANPEECLCYPKLKDLHFRLALAGCTEAQNQAITCFVANPIGWQPQSIDGEPYETFGQFLVAQNLTKCKLSDKIESLVYGFQRDRGISGLKPQYRRIRGTDIEFLAPTRLALLDSDKQVLKAQVPDICKTFFALSDGYKLGRLEYHDDGYEYLEDCEPSAILDAAQLACKAWIDTESHRWEGGIGRPCWKAEPDYIQLFLDFGFEEESPLVTFKAANPTNPHQN
ncbi:hypothetical protein [Tolypothrix sp. VBCCA 56010]|uniref:hypothetical protein n=1 Tax=Tolypothrix sp. VBCCA 56010 TaxID=3137731 RepID=UPI003D7C4860